MCSTKVLHRRVWRSVLTVAEPAFRCHWSREATCQFLRLWKQKVLNFSKVSYPKKILKDLSSGMNICPFILISRTSGVSGPCSWDPGRLVANGLRLFSEARRCELVFVSWEARWAAVLERIWPGNMVARWGWESAGPWVELAPGAREKRREFRLSSIWPGAMEARRIVSSGSPMRRSSSVTVNEGPRLGYGGRTIRLILVLNKQRS